MVTFENVSKSFRGRFALRSMSFTIARGEKVGIIGPNGSGKTTLLQLLCGLLVPDEGRILCEGLPIRDSQFLRNAGVLQDTPRLFFSLSGVENLEVFRRGPLAGNPQPTSDLLNSVGLTEAGARAFRTYSHGMKQRLGLAVALLGSPSVLVLDEPTNALDPIGIVEMRQFIRQASSGDVTVVMASHLLHEVESICDRILVLKDGELITSFNLRDVQRMRNTYIVRLKNPREFIQRFESIGGVRLLRVLDSSVEIESDEYAGFDLLKRILDSGIVCDEFVRKETRLEEVFMDVIA